MEQFFKAWFSWIHLLCYNWIVYSWRRSTVNDGVCKYHTSNAVGIRCKTCEKMATSKSWMNCYSMTTMRIGYEVESQKSGIMYKWATQHDTNANDNIHACVTLYYTDVNDDMHDCVTPHDAHSTDHIHWAPCTFLIVILISSTHLAQVWVSPFTLIHMVIHERVFSSLWPPLSTSLSSCRPCSSCLSSFSSTRSSWQTCTTPQWTPTTSSPSPHEPNGTIGPSDGSPKRLSYGVSHQTRYLECFSKIGKAICPPTLVQTRLQDNSRGAFLYSARCSFSNRICFRSACCTTDSRRDLHKLCRIPRNCQCKCLLASHRAPRTFATFIEFPEKFWFCTDTTGSIGWPSPAPRLHFDDCFKILLLSSHQNLRLEVRTASPLRLLLGALVILVLFTDLAISVLMEWV